MIKIYGKNCIYAAVLAKAKLETIFVSSDVIKKDNKILKLLSDNSLSPKIVDKAFLDKEFGDGHQGYGAYRSDYKILSIDDINMIPKEKGRILILDGIQDPQNLGAIIRSVDAFSYDLIVLPKHNSVSVNKTVAHVSTGAIEYVNIMYVNSLLTLINKLKDMGYWICGTDAKGNVLAENIDKNLNLAIIIGSEGFGMSKTLVNASDYLISIPMTGHVNSLNASVSAGIILKELMANK